MNANVFAIESSCDETAAAVIANGERILSNVVLSQIDLHRKFGGVFPEMASRAHVEAIGVVISEALRKSGLTWSAIDAVAVTRGPGLPGSLVVGVNAAKGIALAHDLPLIGVNHLEGHVYSHWLHTDAQDAPLVHRLAQSFDSPFPVLILIVSGGHTELVLMRDHGEYALIGHTVDDAVGEAFDKVARLLDLGFPGGPAIESAARLGDASRFRFSKPKVALHPKTARGAQDGYLFSFSGAKTAALHMAQPFLTDGRISALAPVNDIAAGFQEAVTDWLVEKTAQAAREFGARAVLVGGGVSANAMLRAKMQRAFGVGVSFPPMALCTDNAAMIGAAAHYAFARGVRHDLTLDVLPDLKLG
jgi:N6-L-threonylcarbamoyladenine synthase